MVDDRQRRFHFTEIVATVFALPFVVAERVYGGESIWKSDMRGYVAYLGGRPVSIVCSVIGGEAIGIYSVGTLPDHQGNGYAESVMRFAIAEASTKTGLERTVLQTTRAGIRLYKRMGYRQVTKFKVYLRESCGSL
jgi:ribosomal protein S18 acetylase RimI-like enzyme